MTTTITAPPVTAAEDAPRVRRRRRGLAPGKRLPASRLTGPVLLLALWACASAAGQLDPGAIPPPCAVLRTAVRLWSAGTLPTDILTSLQRAAYGFAWDPLRGAAVAANSAPVGCRCRDRFRAFLGPRPARKACSGWPSPVDLPETCIRCARERDSRGFSGRGSRVCAWRRRRPGPPWRRR